MILNLKHSFDAAHRLEFHEGKCRNLHGHRWEVEVEIEATPMEKDMLIDFGEIKREINYFDHSCILKECPENEELINLLNKMDLHVITLENSPTAENLSKEIHENIQLRLRKNKIYNFKLKVKVYESPNASITYVGI